MELNDSKYVVIRDSREKLGKGWVFPSGKGRCQGTIVEKMDEGDYTLQGYEDRLCIERKGSVSEVARNITQDRFGAELQRMEKYDFPFVLLEFTMDDLVKYPKGCGMPLKQQIKVKAKGKFFLKRIMEIQFNYKTKVMFCGQYGEEIAISIFNRMIEYEQDYYTRPDDES